MTAMREVGPSGGAKMRRETGFEGKIGGGATPLHHAAAIGDLERCMILIAQGADINAGTAHGVTPLHYAAGSENSELCKYLVVIGADVNARDEDGSTPLHCAADNGELEPSRELDLCEFLIDHGAEVDVRDHDGVTPLRCAADNGDLELCKLLIAKGANACVQKSVSPATKGAEE